MPPLNNAQLQALRKAAADAGVDERDLIAEAESLVDGSQEPDAEGPDLNSDDPAKRLVADRLLVGFLPFIRVRELRRIWFKLDEAFPDEDLPCATWLVKHGGAASRGEEE